MASRKPEAHAAQDRLETTEILTEPPTADPRTDEQRRRNLLQEYEQQFEQLSGAQKTSKLCSNAGLKTFGRGHYFITLIQKDRAEWYISAENTGCRVTMYDLEQEAGFVRTRKLAQSRTFHEDRYHFEFQVPSLFQDRTPPLGFEL